MVCIKLLVLRILFLLGLGLGLGLVLTQSVAGDEGVVGVVDEDGAAKGPVAFEDAFHAAADGAEKAGAGFGGEGDGGRCGLVEEVRFVLEGGLFAFDVMEECIQLFTAVGVVPARFLGFAEVPLEGVFFDFQGIESAAEIRTGGLANVRDFDFERFKFLFSHGNLLGEERGLV